MTYRFLAVALSTTLLTGCAYDPLKPLDPVRAIAPGVYGNVQQSARSGDFVGYELRLPQGGASEALEVTQCTGACSTVHRLPIRRQGEVMRFALPMGGDAPARIFEIQPMMGGMLMLSGFNERGADGIVLRPQRREYGLAMARSQSAAPE